jgi:hypothetical protein
MHATYTMTVSLCTRYSTIRVPSISKRIRIIYIPQECRMAAQSRHTQAVVLLRAGRSGNKRFVAPGPRLRRTLRKSQSKGWRDGSAQR